MSTAIAAAPGAPMHHLDHNPSPRSYPPIAPSTSAPSAERQPEDAGRPYNRTPEGGRQSPRSYGNAMPVDEAALMLDRLRSGGSGSKVVVKKEPPSSPSLQSGARHRPRKLDLDTNTSSMPAPNSRPSATPMTGRDTLGIMQDVGLACLSPGFATHDPTMREQLQRSLSVRDQQRSIIESRLLKSAKGELPENAKDGLPSAGKGPSLASKKRPPPGLSIVPPSAERFANERVVQSAPLNQTFTGRNDAHPAMRQPSNLGPQPSQAAPAIQTSNRLPPISDVFAPNELRPDSRPQFLHTNSTPAHHGPPMPSPSYPPQTAHPMSSYASFERPREYRSAEEAVHDLTGGREELMPKIVHYGGHQPPTPPSPHPHQHSQENTTPHKFAQPSGFAGRRRSRHEYEEGSSPPLGTGRGPRTGPFGEERDSPATQKAKKERFMLLCAEAWDLFHS
jgi:hypothetical protein